VNLDPSLDIHPFMRLHGPYKDSYEALRFGKKLNMGTSQYELVEILTPEKTANMTPPGKSFEGEPTFF